MPSRQSQVMGVVNVTPDSFSDGGRYYDHEAAIAHGRRLVDEGADWVDVGGESTRPGAEPVPADEELRRVLPVVRRWPPPARRCRSTPASPRSPRPRWPPVPG